MANSIAYLKAFSFATALIGSVWMGLAQATTIRVDPLQTQVQTGDSFDVSVIVTEVSDLYAFQFDVSFDPLVIHSLGVDEGPFLPSGGSTYFDQGTIDNVAGMISFVLDTLIGSVPGVTGTGSVATLHFEALVAGVSPIELSQVMLLTSDIEEIPVTISNGSVTVPIPSTVLLLLGGFFMLLGNKRLARVS